MSVVTPTILSGGQEMKPTFGLLSIDIRREVNRVPQADLALLDGDAAEQKFEISNDDFFKPGKKIEIKLRYEGEGKSEGETVFEGVVVRQGVEASAAGSVLLVGLKDAAVKLTGARHSAVFRDKTDHQIIGDLLQQPGLATGTLAETGPKHKEIVQYHCTDWDFMLSRADAHGLLVVVEDGTISLRKPALEGAPKKFDLGVDEIYDFEMEADASHQYGEVQSIAWKLQEQKLTEAAKAKEPELSPGNLDGGKIGKALGFDACTLSHPVPVHADELKAWADARMVRSRLAMVRGRIAVPGWDGIKLLDPILLAGIGDRWNGKILVTGIRHRVDENGWQTDVQFGLSPEWYCRRPEIADCPAAGLLPPATGLRIGVVAAFQDDPDKELRLKVRLPGVGGEAEAVWARLASPDAGKDRGFFFRPEPGDEVVVGFFNDDPRHAVVLGSLFGSRNAPPDGLAELTADNLAKGIVTKMGTTIAFIDDDKASVVIGTAGNNKIFLDDEKIQVSDRHGNSLTLSETGIEITSATDLKIVADGKVEINGEKVDVQ